MHNFVLASASLLLMTNAIYAKDKDIPPVVKTYDGSCSTFDIGDISENCAPKFRILTWKKPFLVGLAQDYGFNDADGKPHTVLAVFYSIKPSQQSNGSSDFIIDQTTLKYDNEQGETFQSSGKCNVMKDKDTSFIECNIKVKFPNKISLYHWVTSGRDVDAQNTEEAPPVSSAPTFKPQREVEGSCSLTMDGDKTDCNPLFLVLADQNNSNNVEFQTVYNVGDNLKVQHTIRMTLTSDGHNSGDNNSENYNIVGANLMKDNNKPIDLPSTGTCNSVLTKDERVTLDCSINVKFSDEIVKYHWIFTEGDDKKNNTSDKL